MMQFFLKKIKIWFTNLEFWLLDWISVQIKSSALDYLEMQLSFRTILTTNSEGIYLCSSLKCSEMCRKLLFFISALVICMYNLAIQNTQQSKCLEINSDTNKLNRIYKSFCWPKVVWMPNGSFCEHKISDNGCLNNEYSIVFIFTKSLLLLTEA